MKQYFITLITLLVAMTAFGQETATTEAGRKVTLHADGTWQYTSQIAMADSLEAAVNARADARADSMEAAADDIVETTEEVAEPEPYRPTGSVFMGGRRMTAGLKTTIHTENFGFTTSVTVARDGDKTLIIFWQDTEDSKMNFFNDKWEKSVYLYLKNGEAILLTDRGMHGQNKITEGKTREYGLKSDIYQRFSAHYLTLAECQKLKRSDLDKIAYHTSSEEGTTYLEATENSNTLREQLLAIGR
ncbi:hypothetical protein PK28_02295 [Hymenobacter sp. DG25B]|uniref:hypothetical protein n=1 Tax=Hymenobacter sp. DG25B TaxID=1385664 RepID=UPI0005411475|nr:hypothetical protein [Hymenobacter sp. DG25B]AIZ62803.1 hypothetical protein PK28_02295 [Hymenobacter sp. DG25B]